MQMRNCKLVLSKAKGMTFTGPKRLYEVNSIASSVNHIDAKALPIFVQSMNLHAPVAGN